MERKTLYLVGEVRYRRGVLRQLVEKYEWEAIKFVESEREVEGGGVVVADRPLPLPFCYLPEQIDQLPAPNSIPVYWFGEGKPEGWREIFGPIPIFKNEGGFWEGRIETPPTSKQVKEMEKIGKEFIVGDLLKFIISRYPPLQIGFAESCTGGLLASLLTSRPGSSAVFPGSMVTYANRIKEEWLGVSPETLRKFGAVSRECVEEMVEGILEKTGADYGVAISGIAGPTGGTPTKPVGTVFIGVGSQKRKWVERYHFRGGRNYVQYQAAMTGLKMLIEIVGIYGVAEGLGNG